jgi:hypothetical protein
VNDWFDLPSDPLNETTISFRGLSTATKPVVLYVGVLKLAVSTCFNEPIVDWFAGAAYNPNLRTVLAPLASTMGQLLALSPPVEPAEWPQSN